MSASLTAPSLPARFAVAIGSLSRGLAVSLRQDWRHAALALAAWTRLRRLLARFSALVAALEAGRLAAPRARPGESRRARPEAPAVRLPGGAGWLLRLAPEPDTRLGRAQVESLLGDPDLQALLLRAPQAGRILRPLCHMLGIEAPAALRRPRLGRRPDHPAGTEAGAATGDRPPERAARPKLPWWLTRPASPPLPNWEDTPDGAPPCPARTGPPEG